MCSQITLTRIQEVLEEKIDNDEMFTAFDISLIVKDMAKTAGETPERHRHMKNDVHKEMQNYLNSGIYTKSLWDVGAPSKAILYYPTGSNPAVYLPQRRTRVPQTPAPTTAAVVSATPSVSASSSCPVGQLIAPAKKKPIAKNKPNSSQNRVADGRGTVTVPTVFVKAVGLQPKEKAYVYKDTLADGSPVVTVSKQQISGKTLITSYTVDDSSNIRVTLHTLKAAGLSSTIAYDFEGDTNKIMICSK